jgi:hypothetical protein
MIYKVSYVVRGGSHPGAILDADEMPQVGSVVTFGGADFEIIEIMELMPARGGFGFLHATCVPVEKEEDEG